MVAGCGLLIILRTQHAPPLLVFALVDFAARVALVENLERTAASAVTVAAHHEQHHAHAQHKHQHYHQRTEEERHWPIIEPHGTLLSVLIKLSVRLLVAWICVNHRFRTDSNPESCCAACRIVS